MPDALKSLIKFDKPPQSPKPAAISRAAARRLHPDRGGKREEFQDMPITANLMKLDLKRLRCSDAVRSCSGVTRPSWPKPLRLH